MATWVFLGGVLNWSRNKTADEFCAIICGWITFISIVHTLWKKTYVVTPLSIGKSCLQKVNCDTVATNYSFSWLIYVYIYIYIQCNVSLLLFDEEFLTHKTERNAASHRASISWRVLNLNLIWHRFITVILLNFVAINSWIFFIILACSATCSSWY
jgi:hypothetical protein